MISSMHTQNEKIWLQFGLSTENNIIFSAPSCVPDTLLDTFLYGMSVLLIYLHAVTDRGARLRHRLILVRDR